MLLRWSHDGSIGLVLLRMAFALLNPRSTTLWFVSRIFMGLIVSLVVTID